MASTSISSKIVPLYSIFFLGTDSIFSRSFFKPLPPVVSHDSDDNVFAAASAAERLAQHAERFADTRGIAKEELKDAACLLRRRCNFQPLFRLLRQGAIFSAAIRKPALE